MVGAMCGGASIATVGKGLPVGVFAGEARARLLAVFFLGLAAKADLTADLIALRVAGEAAAASSA